MPATLPILTPADLASDQEVRWCPGCGDFAILAQFKKVLAHLGVPREKLAIISGSGCAGRMPYYLNTYGFHSLHGRAFSIATGLKAAQPDLQVWVVTGDGDALAIGAGSLLHTLRRNVDIKIVMLNNEVLGLTKGQHSPTSRPGTRTKSSPDGSVETPLKGAALALASEATFVARTVDVDNDHLSEVLTRAAAHKGTAFVEIYQNCKVFNDGVFDYAADKSVKEDHTLRLEHGRPLVFGKDRTQGLRLNGLAPEIVPLGNDYSVDDLIVHDEKQDDPMLAFFLARLTFPDFPECLGVLRAVERPTYEELVRSQNSVNKSARKLADLLAGDETWKIA